MVERHIQTHSNSQMVTGRQSTDDIITQDSFKRKKWFSQAKFLVYIAGGQSQADNYIFQLITGQIKSLKSFSFHWSWISECTSFIQVDLLYLVSRMRDWSWGSRSCERWQQIYPPFDWLFHSKEKSQDLWKKETKNFTRNSAFHTRVSFTCKCICSSLAYIFYSIPKVKLKIFFKLFQPPESPTPV